MVDHADLLDLDIMFGERITEHDDLATVATRLAKQARQPDRQPDRQPGESSVEGPE